MTGWTAAQMPRQEGIHAVVTGANSGLGLVIARELARAGATVVMACRDAARGERALREVRAAAPGADVTLDSLDLADLRSVREFAGRLAAAGTAVHLLVNNAGVMAPPRRETADGFESQMGINHLGHFALTGLLLGRLLAAARPRVVTMSSAAHRIGKIRFDDLQSWQRYRRWRAYGQSKLANLLFCFELQRRATAARSTLLSLAAHPGFAATNLQMAGPANPIERRALALGTALWAQGAEMGALPALYAATVLDLPGATFVGPDGPGERRGYPRVVGAAGKAYDDDAARRLWIESERLTGVVYDFAAAA